MNSIFIIAALWIKNQAPQRQFLNVSFSWNTVLFISVGSVLLLKLFMCQDQLCLSQYVQHSQLKQICAKYLLDGCYFISLCRKRFLVKNKHQHVDPKPKVLLAVNVNVIIFVLFIPAASCIFSPECKCLPSRQYL